MSVGPHGVIATCHYDVLEWLQPDWIYDAGSADFQWRELQRRPSIELRICRVDKTAWRIFKRHHYLSADLAPSATCFCGVVNGRPAAFTAVLPFPHATRPGRREHRTVCLPDFQGVGIGNAMSEFVASLYPAAKPYFSTTSHPAMIAHRAKSPLWKMGRPPGRTSGGGDFKNPALKATRACGRLTAGFEYVGPRNPKEAMKFGISA